MSVDVPPVAGAPHLPRAQLRLLVTAATATTVLISGAGAVLMIVNRDNRVPGSAVDLDQMLGQPVFTATKIVAAVLFAVAGWVLVTRRPDVPVGYLALAGGLANAIAVVGGQWAIYARVGGHEVPLVGVALWLGSWPYAFEPAVLVGFYLFFPTGRIAARPGSWFAGTAVGLCAVGSVGAILAPLHPDPRGPFADLGNPLPVSFSGLDALLGIGLVVGNGALIARWLRSPEESRRQFRTLAVVAAIGFVLPLLPTSTETARVLYELHTVLLLLVVMAAVLRHQLYGIDVVLNRTLVYLILSGVIAGVYGLLVGASVLIAGHANLAVTPVAAVIAAMCLLPARGHVQRLVNRFLYGSRDEPFAVLTRIGAHLETSVDPAELLNGLLRAVMDALRLPGAQLVLATPDGIATTISAGSVGEATDTFLLTYQGESLGQLVIARRPGQPTLPADEAELLSQVARQAAVAAHSVILLDQLTRSRERVIGVAEDERRRLRGDLHDGLGPLLTAAATRIDACRNLLDRDLPQVESLLDEVRDDLTEGLSDLRRLVYALRPPVLDELGLRHAVQEVCRRSGIRAAADLPAEMPALPAAVEITAYRIVAEAVANVARHSGAANCTVTMALGSRLVIDICDDGDSDGEWRAGVGLSSMRERTVELGGTWSAGPQPGGGGRVRAELPLTLFGVTA